MSGLALALSYSPSVPAAWASVAHLEESGLGRLLRSLHAHGATFLLVVVALHLLQTALSGAYRAPREVTWWLGLLLLVLLLGFCITGSLLPWDERGYWATRVTVGIAAGTPVVGPPLAAALVGGRELGNLTLTRFYTLHAMLLPLLLLAFGAAHVLGVRRHGITPIARGGPDEPFWPRQALYDGAFSLLLLAGLLALALAAPAPLQAPAAPAGVASARPDWYFLPLFQLLKLVPERVATLLIPALAAVFLAALPVLDRGARSRLPVMLVLAGGLASAVALGVAAVQADRASPTFTAEREAADRRARKARELARTRGVPPEGALAMLEDQPEERGKRLFAAACAQCHGATAGKGPPLGQGYLSRAWIRGVIEHPDAPAYFGRTTISGMEGAAALGADKLARLADFVHALRSTAPEDPALESGRRLFQQEGCTECHTLSAAEPSAAPSLAGYGSAAWLRGLLSNPGGALYYDTQNQMPGFSGKLAARDLDDLVVYLKSLEEGAP